MAKSKIESNFSRVGLKNCKNPKKIGRKIKSKKEIVPKIPVVARVSKNFEAEFENLMFQKIVLFKSPPICFEKLQIKVPGPVPKIGFSFNDFKAILNERP